jgi:hypothetical protein
MRMPRRTTHNPLMLVENLRQWVGRELSLSAGRGFTESSNNSRRTWRMLDRTLIN